MNYLFFNEFGRLRSGWRFATFLSFFLVITTSLSLFFLTIVSFFKSNLTESGEGFSVFLGIFSQALITLFVGIFLAFIYGKIFESLPFKALGWTFHQGWLKDLFWGLLYGAVAILSAVTIPFIFGGISFKLNENADISSILQTLGLSGMIFILGAAAEETLFRGYLLQTMSRAKLAWLGVLLTSLPFALAHLGNPNVSPWFTFINTTLAGIWLGVAYLKTRSMWFPFALHFIWNWFQGAILGINVSGLKELAPHPILQSIDTGPTWLTGGHYGIEGGISCSIAILISTLMIYFLPNLKPNPELLTLTNEEIPTKNFEKPV